MIFNTNTNTNTNTTSSFPTQMGTNTSTKDPKREIAITSIDDTTSAANKKHKQQIIPFTTTTTNTEGADGSSIEITKRPRGRPPGSKNKPRPPLIITREIDPASAMRPHVLEIQPGHDVIAALVSFSRRKNLGLCVIAATGAVSNVTIRQPPHPAADVGSVTATVGFGGRFEILSMSATVMPPSVSAVNSSSAAVLLAGPQGQVIGGTVVGPLVAAGTVTVVAAAFENPAFQRLPAVDEVEVSVSVSEGEENLNRSQQQRQQQQQQVEVQEQEQAQQQHYVHHREYPHQSRGPGGDSCAVFSTHFTADVIWPPAAARPPHY